MSEASESRMQSWRRASPTDSLAAVAGIVCTIIAANNPEAFSRFEPAQVATIAAGAGTVGAMLRAWWRARRRRRKQRRQG